MLWRTLSLCVFFCVTLFFGIVIGYTAKPQFTVQAYDPSVCVPDAKDLPEDLRAQRKVGFVRSDYIDESVKVMRGMKPLVKAGPFHMAWNPDTDDFWITLRNGNQTLVTQMNIENETELSFSAKRGERDIICYYDNNSGKLSGNVYSASRIDNEGKPDTLYSYFDTNGDGKLNKMRDHRSGVLYEMKGLQWVAAE